MKPHPKNIGAVGRVTLTGAEEWCVDTLLRSGRGRYLDRARASFGSSIRAEVVARAAEERSARAK